MAPSNFRTYEAQSRLLAAVIASSPSLKLNFKEIALHFGSDATASSIEHRFRPIKKQVAAVRKAVAAGTDAKDLADLFLLRDKEIAKLYGESTPMGIEFQFRAIRKDAKALREAVDRGENPLSTRTTTADGAAPRKRRAPAGAAAAAAVRASAGVQATPRKRARTAEAAFSNEEDGSGGTSEVNYDELDVTPVSTPSARFVAASAPSSVIDLVDDDDQQQQQQQYTDSPTPTTTAVTPSTTMSAAYVLDATPALTVGATPSEASPSTAADEFYTAPRTQRIQQASQSQASNARGSARSAWARELNMSYFEEDAENDNDNDDDDDDDDVFIVDTPSKTPKMEPGVSNKPLSTVAPAATALSFPPDHAAGSFASRAGSSDTVGRGSFYEPSLGGGSSSIGGSSWDVLGHDPVPGPADFSFGTSSSNNDAWTQPEFFHSGAGPVGFSHATAYDDDEAI